MTTQVIVHDGQLTRIMRGVLLCGLAVCSPILILGGMVYGLAWIGPSDLVLSQPQHRTSEYLRAVGFDPSLAHPVSIVRLAVGTTGKLEGGGGVTYGTGRFSIHGEQQLSAVVPVLVNVGGQEITLVVPTDRLVVTRSELLSTGRFHLPDPVLGRSEVKQHHDRSCRSLTRPDCYEVVEQRTGLKGTTAWLDIQKQGQIEFIRQQLVGATKVELKLNAEDYARLRG